MGLRALLQQQHGVDVGRWSTDWIDLSRERGKQRIELARTFRGVDRTCMNYAVYTEKASPLRHQCCSSTLPMHSLLTTSSIHKPPPPMPPRSSPPLHTHTHPLLKRRRPLQPNAIPHKQLIQKMLMPNPRRARLSKRVNSLLHPEPLPLDQVRHDEKPRPVEAVVAVHAYQRFILCAPRLVGAQGGVRAAGSSDRGGLRP